MCTEIWPVAFWATLCDINDVLWEISEQVRSDVTLTARTGAATVRVRGN
jgi:hypothetical protein